MKNLILLLIAFFISGFGAASQSRIVLNGGRTVLQNGAYLVIGNSSADALTVLATSGGITTDAGSFLRWNIGTTAGIYSVPYFFSNTYLPFSFSTSGASGTGYFDLNSYNVPTWKNSDHLPAGVTNVNNSGGADNSARLIDRFWSVGATGYTIKPILSNVTFGYRDDEWLATGNTISETNLKAQRWNSNSMTWNDYIPAGIANIADNTVTVPGISSADLFQWWTLVDFLQAPVPIHLLAFSAKAVSNNAVQTKWITSSESNSSHFVLERSQNGITFNAINTIPAAGYSNLELSYEATDPSPFSGRSFYRLKMVDLDGSFKYSPVASVTINEISRIEIYPNPVISNLFIDIHRPDPKKIMLFNEKGQTILFRSPVSGINKIDLKTLPAGIYWLKIIFEKDTEVFKIIRQ